MKPRERLLKAWKKAPGLPDRVPIQFELCASLLEHFGRKLGFPVHYTNNLYEDVTFRISANELRTAMGCEVVTVGAAEHTGIAPQRFADGTWLNEYGMRMRQGSIYVEVAEHPLAGVETVQDLAGYAFPDPDAPGRVEKFLELCRQHGRY